MEEALLSGSLVNKRLNLRACIVGKSLETAVVKTYRLIQSGFLSQHSATMQLSPNVAASNTAPNALVVKTFWSKPLIYRERHTKMAPIGEDGLSIGKNGLYYSAGRQGALSFATVAQWWIETWEGEVHLIGDI